MSRHLWGLSSLSLTPPTSASGQNQGVALDHLSSSDMTLQPVLPAVPSKSIPALSTAPLPLPPPGPAHHHPPGSVAVSAKAPALTFHRLSF